MTTTTPTPRWSVIKPGASRAWSRRAALVAQELILPIVLVATWWVATDSSTSLYFPSLRSILTAFRDTWLFDQVRPTLLPTLETFAIGYGLSLVLGIVIGMALAASPAVAAFLKPLMEFIRALPGVALVPVFMAMLGVGMEMRLSIVVFASIWPIMLNTIDGIRGLDEVTRETASTFRLRFLPRLALVTLPGASPQIVAGARVGLSLSLIAVVVTEMVAPSDGVGAFARSAQMSFNITRMWTVLILMGLVGYALNALFVLVERRILRWHRHMHALAGR